MPNRVLAVVDQIVGEPAQAGCSGRILPEGGGNPIAFEARWNYGIGANNIELAISNAVRAAMTAAGQAMEPTDKVTLFGTFSVFT